MPRLTCPPLFPQANLAVQQNRLAIANTDLQKAQAELDAKQAELDVVQADYEKAMMEKQVSQRRLVIPPTPHKSPYQSRQNGVWTELWWLHCEVA